MSKTFRPWKIDEPLLLPVWVQDFVGEDHLARFVVDLVIDHGGRSSKCCASCMTP
jgi:hypothetical protein